MAQLAKNLPAMWETWVRSLGWEDPLDEKKGYPLQYSGLENSMDCIVHGVEKSWTRLSNFHFHFQEETSYQAVRRQGGNFNAYYYDKHSVLKSRDIILPTKVHIVKAMVFPVICTDVRVGP